MVIKVVVGDLDSVDGVCFYEVTVTNESGQEWRVDKRFNEFRDLDKEIVIDGRLAKKKVELPTTGRFGIRKSLRMSTFMDARKEGLNKYIQSLCAQVSTLEENDVLHRFLAQPATSCMKPYKLNTAEHVSALKDVFQFQGYIQQTEHRAITLRQLNRILKFATDHCGGWYDSSPPEHSKLSGQTLHISTLNLYHLNTWLIMPSTKDDACSFVELLTGQSQTPKWFISHWWGEIFINFVRCIAAHVHVRQLPEGVKAPNRSWPPMSPWTEAVNGSTDDDLLDEDSTFWVCAYANRQHSLHTELTKNPQETSFFKALQLSVGVLIVLNDKTEHADAAVAFTRIWCAFEQATVIQQTGSPRMLLDIAAVSKNRAGECIAHILSDGIAALDSAVGFGGSKLAPMLKQKRERSFPIRVLRQGLTLQLETAEATHDEDKRCILNCLLGRDLDLPPIREHIIYDRINKALRGVFAVVAWNQALGSYTPQLDLVAELGLPAVLAADVERKVLDMDFSGYENFLGNEEVETLSSGLPPALLELSLRFRQCDGFSDVGVSALANALPCTLRNLVLDFSHCSLTDVCVRSIACKLPAGMIWLHLDFSNCTQVTDAGVMALASCFPACVERLELNFALCAKITNVGVMQLAQDLPKQTKQLKMIFAACTELTNAALVRLAEVIPQRLEKLGVSFSNCANIGDEAAGTLAAKLPPLLTELHTDFTYTLVSGGQECHTVHDFRSQFCKPQEKQHPAKRDFAQTSGY